jgi:CheY-like chemotaxis protein
MKLNCILLIDDDRICNYLHEKIIRRLDLSVDVRSAFNGLEALRMIQEYYSEHHAPPELILLDLKMPVMDGFEFIKKFQENFPKLIHQTKIAIITTSGHPADVQKISCLKNISFYIKPLTEEKLKSISEQVKLVYIKNQKRKVLVKNMAADSGNKKISCQ